MVAFVNPAPATAALLTTPLLHPLKTDDGEATLCGKAKTGATGTWLATHSMNSACACEQFCANNPECKAWQWFPAAGASQPAKAKDCYLKSSAGLAPNAGSVAAEARPRPPPPPPPPPPRTWPPRGAVVAVELVERTRRPAVKYGFGNELCWQAVNDTARSHLPRIAILLIPGTGGDRS